MSDIGRKPGHEGYWKGKTWKKPSVFTDIDEWIGWDKLQELVEGPEEEVDQMILKILFETGARVSELIQYKSEHFKLMGKLIRVEKAPLVKNDKLNYRWPYTIPANEPFAEDLLEWAKKRNGWLFPSKLGRKPYYTRQYVWNVAKEHIDKYPHWFRSQRAFCLSWYHDFRPEELQAWFTWTDAQTPQHYARPSPDKYSKKFKGI